MQKWTASLLKKENLLLGEGACWHQGWNKFLFVDIEGKKVGCIDPLTAEISVRVLPERIGAVVPCTKNGLLLALQGSLELMDFETGERQLVCSIEPDKPENRCNDGKCDAEGRFWIGTMHVHAKQAAGALYCYDGKLRKILSSISISNGICWKKDNTVMYYIDSGNPFIRSYEYDLSTGTISTEKVVVRIAEPGFVPDGMCIDDEGMLWVAMWGGSCVKRFDPATGHAIGRIDVPALQVTTCAFGGKDYQQLLIMTASVGLDKDQMEAWPLNGSIFIADTGIKGSPTHHFKLPEILQS